ncbi:MAG TPA: hypothetical protein VF613_11400 [Longimicrobium sp.]|jgi:hypothetical protein
MKMKKISFALLGALLALASAPAADAQVFSPTFQAPYMSNDVGLYISDFEDELGIEGILRRGMGSFDLGLRLGLVEDAVLLGIDTRNPLAVAGTAPLALALTLGGQAALGDENVFGAQVGLSIGHAFRTPGATITPYIHPRAALLFGGDEEDFEALADVGVDVALRPNFILRFGANLAEGADFGIGLALRR